MVLMKLVPGPNLTWGIFGKIFKYVLQKIVLKYIPGIYRGVESNTNLNIDLTQNSYF